MAGFKPTTTKTYWNWTPINNDQTLSYKDLWRVLKTYNPSGGWRAKNNTITKLAQARTSINNILNMKNRNDWVNIGIAPGDDVFYIKAAVMTFVEYQDGLIRKRAGAKAKLKRGVARYKSKLDQRRETQQFLADRKARQQGKWDRNYRNRGQVVDNTHAKSLVPVDERGFVIPEPRARPIIPKRVNRGVNPQAKPFVPRQEAPTPVDPRDSYFGRKAQQIKIIKKIALSRPLWRSREVDQMYNYLYK